MILGSSVSFYIFCLLDLSTTERGVGVSNYNSALSVSPQGSISLSLVFWYPVVRYIHVKNSCVFLENRALYHYVIPLLISGNFPCSEVCLV